MVPGVKVMVQLLLGAIESQVVAVTYPDKLVFVKSAATLVAVAVEDVLVMVIVPVVVPFACKVRGEPAMLRVASEPPFTAIVAEVSVVLVPFIAIVVGSSVVELDVNTNSQSLLPGARFAHPGLGV